MLSFFKFSQITKAVLLASVFFAFSSSYAQFSVEVGDQPLAFVYSDGMEDGFFVICGGQDSDFNGSLDDGETPGSIWFISEEVDGFASEKMIDIPGSFPNYPHGFVVAENGTFLVVLSNGNITSYDIENNILVPQPALGSDNRAGVQLEDIGVLRLETNDNNESSFVLRADVPIIGATDFEIDAGEFAELMGIAFDESEEALYLLTTNRVEEGNFDDFVLQYGELVINETSFTVTWDYKTIVIGSQPNDIEFNFDGDDATTVAIVCNMSHEVYIFDVIEEEIIQVIDTGTEGFDGPNKAFFVDNEYIAVSQFDNRVVLYEIETGNPVMDVMTENEPFDLIVAGDTPLEYTAIYTEVRKEDFSPANRVVFSELFPISVEEGYEKVNFKLYPTVVKDKMNIEIGSELIGRDFMVFSYSGEEVFSGSIDSERISIDRNELPASGLYYVRIGGSVKPVFVR
ncbi:MAG: hypothetical protein Kapaf2KO_05190 [Candidatus Kapaibacteriales bacterium]